MIIVNRKMGKLLLLLCLVHQSSAVIYHLNSLWPLLWILLCVEGAYQCILELEVTTYHGFQMSCKMNQFAFKVTEYSEMPELFEMDNYDACVGEPGGTYCLLDAVLYSRDDSDLMRMIQGYSDYKLKHFNHTKVHRALCVSRSCKEFIGNRSLDNEADLKAILEECVDNSMWKDYKLNARLSEILYCKKYGQKRPFEIGDYIVGGIYLTLLILNAVGTSYDIIMADTARNPYLLAFSLRRNWRKLIAPSGVGPEPRLNRLRAFNGLRTMTMICVFLSHSTLVHIFSYIKNPYYLETAYDDLENYILFNGTLVTMTFFVMSGFLLAFNLEIYAEKHRVTLWEWPKGMLMRWLRLTPIYALTMFTIMTINRHFGDGPLWELLVTDEATACKQYWWAHLLYINNYIYDDSHCFPQSWYLAADTQLFGLGLLLCILCRKPRTQIAALAVLFAISLLIPAAYVYFQGLGAVVYQSPETVRSLFRFDETYRITFVAAHTNMSTYVLGIAGGLLAYHWLKNEKSVPRLLQKCPWLIWLTFPVALGTILSGGFFYMDHYEPSTLVKVIYAAVHRPLFQVNVVILIIACIFKIESLFRGILEWRGFTWAARASYGGFLIHSILQRGLFGASRQPAYMSDYHILTVLASTIFLTLSAGAVLFITVESPLVVVTKTILSPPKPTEPNTEDAATKDVSTKV